MRGAKLTLTHAYRPPNVGWRVGHGPFQLRSDFHEETRLIKWWELIVAFFNGKLGCSPFFIPVHLWFFTKDAHHSEWERQHNTFMDFYRSPIRLIDCHSQKQAFLDVIIVHKCRLLSIWSYISAAALSRFQIQKHIQKKFVFIYLYFKLFYCIRYQIKSLKLKNMFKPRWAKLKYPFNINYMKKYNVKQYHKISNIILIFYIIYNIKKYIYHCKYYLFIGNNNSGTIVAVKNIYYGDNSVCEEHLLRGQ